MLAAVKRIKQRKRLEGRTRPEIPRCFVVESATKTKNRPPKHEQ